MKTLIIGSDSLIGKALMEYLNKNNSRAIGTTRRREAVDENHLFLDLSGDIESWQCPFSVNTAVICAGTTEIKACENDPAGSRRINVDAVLRLAKKLLEKGLFIIYLSSDKVFDGSKPHSPANSPLSPVTEYGKQKAEVEKQISGFKDSVAIVRLTKVLGPQDRLFSAWREALKKRKAIHPFSDVVLSPLPLSFVVKVISIIIQRRLSGILQISGNRDMSYAEAAEEGLRLLNIPRDLIKPVKAAGLGIYTEPIPVYTSLNTDRLKSVLGVEPPDVFWTVEKIFTEPQALGVCEGCLHNNIRQVE